jgi:hypothetical protein
MAEPPIGDDWPSPKNKIGDTDHVHAIGQISLVLNFLEDVFGNLFQLIFPADLSYGEGLFHGLNNRDRVDMFSAIVRFHQKEAEVSSRLLDAMRYFNICADNRNIVMHSVSQFDDTPSPIMRLAKKAARDPKKTNYYNLSLEDLRRVADETAATFLFLFKMSIWLDKRADGKSPQIDALPDKPIQPRILNPTQPEVIGEG